MVTQKFCDSATQIQSFLNHRFRLYLIVNCVPFLFCITTASIYMAIYYIAFNSLQNIVIEVFRLSINFSSQQIRNALLTVALERIVATIKLEKYKMATKFSLFCYLTLLSYSTSAVYTCFIYYCKCHSGYPGAERGVSWMVLNVSAWARQDFPGQIWHP